MHVEPSRVRDSEKHVSGSSRVGVQSLPRRCIDVVEVGNKGLDLSGERGALVKSVSKHCRRCFLSAHHQLNFDVNNR